MSALTLKIVTPDGNDRVISCDSVTLWMSADSKGRQEGSIGIRKGHTEAVIALGNGPLEAHQEGKLIFSARSEGGFATVLNDTITVITNHLTENSSDL